jgi:hypothetical protein
MLRAAGGGARPAVEWLKSVQAKKKEEKKITL